MYKNYFVREYSGEIVKSDKETFLLYLNNFGAFFLSPQGYEVDKTQVSQIIKVYADNGQLIAYRD
jgi:hypothetical protein